MLSDKFVSLLFLALAFSIPLHGQLRVSHRGGGALAPENTLAGVRIGLSQDVDALEVDVHQTKDSVVVVIHDETVDRTTDGKGRVDELSYGEIQKLDAGSWKGEEFAGEPVPKLEEVLDLVNGKCEVWIEIKGGKAEYPGLEQRIIDMIDARNARKWIQIISFDAHALEKVHALAPDIRLQYLVYVPMKGLPIFIDHGMRGGRPWKIDFVDGIGLYYKKATKGMVRRAHKRGLKLNVWTVNTPAEVAEMRNCGVDAVTSDRVDLWK